MQSKVTSSLAFATKVDAWTWIVLSLAGVMMVGSALTRALAADSLSAMLAAFAAPALVTATVGLVALPTRYELHARELVVRSGILRYRVAYPDIQTVVPSHNVLAAPAWSLDRLKIVRGFGYLLISPRDKQAFLTALAERTPHLVLQGDRLVGA